MFNIKTIKNNSEQKKNGNNDKFVIFILLCVSLRFFSYWIASSPSWLFVVDWNSWFFSSIVEFKYFTFITMIVIKGYNILIMILGGHMYVRKSSRRF